MSIDSQGIVIEMSVSGLKANDVILNLNGNSLVVSGEHQRRNIHANYLNKELYVGPFCRTFPINSNKYDITKIRSDLVHGLLTIRIPYKNLTQINIIQTLDITEGKNGS
jgi:HSP20 family molecular chaperone IbpA